MIEQFQVGDLVYWFEQKDNLGVVCKIINGLEIQTIKILWLIISPTWIMSEKYDITSHDVDKNFREFYKKVEN
jgi:hypothetical protein